MLRYTSKPYKVFTVFNYIFLGILAILCLFPILHIFALSFSSNAAASAGKVLLWPVEPTLASYEYVFRQSQFLTSFGNSVVRVLLGTAVNMVLILFIAYPLSKETKQFRMRTFYAWFFLLTTLFSGGLIPTYMTVRNTGLMDTIWALILPGAVPVFNVILMLNFFRGIPKEIEEAAIIDGAGHVTIMLKLFVPISIPSIATVLLFTMVGHWNAWFDGLIYMNRPENYPLSSFLQTLVIQTSQTSTNMSETNARWLAMVSDRTAKSAQIFIGMLPILCVYPFLQKYFTTGLVLGSVKG